MSRAILIGALLVGGAIAGLILSEAAYRFGRQFVCVAGYPNIFELRSWGWTHRANASVWMQGCIGRRFEWKSQVSFNAHGLRDRDFPYEKTNAHRIFILGDSITEGIQVRSDETFAKLVEANLAAQGETIEVINGGHAGFGTDSELFFYREEARRYSPDLVLLAFNFQNDMLENSPILYREIYDHAAVRYPAKPWFDVGPDGSLQQFPVLPFTERPVDVGTTMWQAVASHFYLFRALGRPQPTGVKWGYPINYEEYAPFDDRWAHAWELTTHLVRQLRTDVERGRSRFAIALIPTKEMVSPAAFEQSLQFFGVQRRDFDLEQPHRLMTAFLTSEGIP